MLTFGDDREQGLPIQSFESYSPFGSIGVGDFVNTAGWGLAFEGHGLTVVKISHQFAETKEEIFHRTLVYCRWHSEGAHTTLS